MGKWYNLKDEDLMPFGKHKGVKMKDLPEDYCLFLYENKTRSGSVNEYISRNIGIIRNKSKVEELRYKMNNLIDGFEQYLDKEEYQELCDCISTIIQYSLEVENKKTTLLKSSF